MRKRVKNVILTTLFAIGLAGGCAPKPAPPAQPPLPEKAPDSHVKTEISTTDGQQLWGLIRTGYAVIAVSGSAVSDEPNPPFDSPEPPPETKDLQILIAHQVQSPEAKIVGEVLFEDYGILQTIPATSGPIGELSVRIEISGPPEDGNRRIKSGLGFSHGMDLPKSGGAQVNMPSGASEEESHTHFRTAVRECLALAFIDLEQRADAFAPPTLLEP